MKQYVVDAFTDELFKGNPAAVCVMDEWISDELMRNIAKENNLSETAFTVKEGGSYRLRWFTPKEEINFCGHATLGTSFVIANYVEPGCKTIKYNTLSGEMSVEVKDGTFVMDFPRYRLDPVEVTDAMERTLGVRPIAAFKDRDLLMVLESEDKVFGLKPDLAAIGELDGTCVAVTAKGTEYDCVSRVFAPELSIPEDPVTGSTHCMIAPYWAKRLGKSSITAFQASERTGVLYAEVCGERVKISGRAVLFGAAEILADL
ncbi:MAG: PhzF family phenazine biosynthesis protein [Ruminococcaceae bacterium]|nr:PhzF family phenazine biosynthesis protein [Oscillospiraceae bacterium]